MKKRSKIALAVILLVLLVLVLVMIIAVSSSGLQTAVVRRFLPKEMTVANFHLGFRGLTVEGGVYRDDQVHIATDRIKADFSLLRMLSRRPLQIREITAQLRVDLTHWEAAPRPERARDEAPPAHERHWEDLSEFKGFFRDPVAWPAFFIDVLKINLDLTLPGGQRQAMVRIDGENIGKTARPEVRMAFEYHDESADTRMRGGSIVNTLGLTLDAEGEIKGIDLDILAETETRLDDDQWQTQTLAGLLYLRQREDAGGEEYRLAATLSPRAPEPLEVILVNALFDYETEAFSGTWDIDIDTRAVASLTAPFLKDAWGTLQATGSFAMQPQEQTALLRGQARAQAENLDRWQPELAATPSFLVNAEFDFASRAEQIVVNRLDLELSAPLDRPLLSLVTEQPFGFDLETNEPIETDHEQPLMRLTISALPVELLNAMLADTHLELASFTGEFVVLAGDQSISLVAIRPLTAARLYLQHNGESMLEDLTVSLAPSIDFRSDGWSFELAASGQVQEDRQILQFSSQGTARLQEDEELVMALQANWAIDLAQLLAQPAALPFRNLGNGHLEGSLELEGSLAQITTDIDLRLHSLVVADNGQRLDSANLAIMVEAGLGEKPLQVKARGPIELQAGNQRSDLMLNLDLWGGAETKQVDLAIQGQRLYVDHLLTIAAAFQNPDFAEPDAPDEPDTAPLWSGILGEAAIEIEELILPGEVQFTEVAATARILENSLSLENFEAFLGTSPLAARGELVFRQEVPARPYLMQADFAIRNFDMGNYFRAIFPETEPVYEGIVSATGSARSEAPSPALLAENLEAEIEASADHVVVRALRRGAVTGAIDLLGALGRLGGRLAGMEDVEAVSQLISYFDAIRFDQLLLVAHLQPDFTVEVERLFLRNPDLIIQGQGIIAYREDRRIHQQPIDMILNMAARPPLARLFNELNLLRREADEEGYRPLVRPVQITGNIGEPDPRPMWMIILDAAAGRLLNGRGRERERPSIPLDNILDLLR